MTTNHFSGVFSYMNIFFLEHITSYPTVEAWAESNAQSHSDQHLNKMVSELLQMFNASSNALNLSCHNPNAKGYQNHPCSVWMRSSLYAWQLCYKLAEALNDEGNRRNPNRKKDHESWTNIQTYIDFNAGGLLTNDNIAPPAQAMPEHYRNLDPVAAYREYYCKDKAWFARKKKVKTEVFGAIVETVKYEVFPASWKTGAPSWWNPCKFEDALQRGVIKYWAGNKEKHLTPDMKDLILLKD